MSVNKVFLLGNLGRDVELRALNNGGSVCNLRVATNEVRKLQDGGRVDATEWHDVVVFGKVAEVCAARLHKGDKVFVEGRLRTRKWEDKGGNQRVSTEVIATTVEFCNRRESATVSSEERDSGVDN